MSSIYFDNTITLTCRDSASQPAFSRFPGLHIEPLPDKEEKAGACLFTVRQSRIVDEETSKKLVETLVDWVKDL